MLEETGGPELLTVQRGARAGRRRGVDARERPRRGVNFLDILVRQGRYPQPPELPWTPGLEVSGETDEGRRVVGLVRQLGGGYAERTGVDDAGCSTCPRQRRSKRARRS